jgi:hypothetical protein
VTDRVHMKARLLTYTGEFLRRLMSAQGDAHRMRWEYSRVGDIVENEARIILKCILGTRAVRKETDLG